MDIQENWLSNFKAVVAAEIQAAGNKEADGYRAVEARTGLGYDYIYQIYKGKPASKPKRPSADVMNTINRVYGDGSQTEWVSQPVSVVPLFAVTNREIGNVELAPDYKNLRLYPVLSEVQAGAWTEICETFIRNDAEEWRASSHDLGECGFMLRVKGLSMANPHGKYTFPPGCLLHVRADKAPTPGQFVVVLRHGENAATFKRLTHIDGVPYLEAINPEWPVRYIKLEDGDVFCGTVKSASFDMP